jgi:hypothetical protein
MAAPGATEAAAAPARTASATAAPERVVHVVGADDAQVEWTGDSAEVARQTRLPGMIGKELARGRLSVRSVSRSTERPLSTVTSS